MDNKNALPQNVNRQFISDFTGITKYVILLEIRKNKVVLQQHGHRDKYSIPIAEFEKKYRRP